MARKFENDFKTTIVELLKSGSKVSVVSQEYNLHQSMIRRWSREYEAKSGDLSKKRALSAEEQELKSLKKELRETTLERDILKKAVGIFSKSDK
jgi:transposase